MQYAIDKMRYNTSSIDYALPPPSASPDANYEDEYEAPNDYNDRYDFDYDGYEDEDMSPAY